MESKEHACAGEIGSWRFSSIVRQVVEEIIMINLGNRQILFVCTANLCRSPTAEALLKNEEGYEVKSAGISVISPVKVTRELVDWADSIFVMENIHKKALVQMDKNAGWKIRVLNIPDIYCEGHPDLIQQLIKKLKVHGITVRTKNQRNHYA